MPARLIPDDDAGRTEAIRVLRANGLVALPTDTVYGLAALPAAVERLFEAKQRPGEKRIVLLVDGLDQAADLARPTPAAVALAALWPGGLTLVLPGRDGSTIAFRVPDHPTPRALARALGPMPTTSANRSGEPEARSAGEVLAALGDAIDLVLDGGPSPVGRPSTVVDCTGRRISILREGAVAASEIQAALGEARTGAG